MNIINENTEKTVKARAKIAYVISITSCPIKQRSYLSDGAAVLKHSVHLNSIQSKSSSYDYKMFAIIHISARNCSYLFSNLGYTVMIRDVPVKVQDIQGQYLREHVTTNGCCGEKEFIKLHAYTLIDYPVVVHLDIDTLIVKPLDVLFDAIMVKQSNHTLNHNTISSDHLMWHDGSSNMTLLPQQIDAFFTRDYNMARPQKKHVGVQGGFLVLKPSLNIYQLFHSILRKGDFQQGKGWGGLGYGTFYGSMTFQGIIPYLYDGLGQSVGVTAVELNRCVWNSMADNPRNQRTRVDNVAVGNCTDGRETCEDCRLRNFETIHTVHFTLCQKPWECLAHNRDRIQEWLCRKFFSEWYRIRADLELTWEGKKLREVEDMNAGRKIIVGNGNYDKNHFRGFCRQSGKSGYIPMEVPSLNSRIKE